MESFQKALKQQRNNQNVQRSVRIDSQSDQAGGLDKNRASRLTPIQRDKFITVKGEKTKHKIQSPNRSDGATRNNLSDKQGLFTEQQALSTSSSPKQAIMISENISNNPASFKQICESQKQVTQESTNNKKNVIQRNMSKEKLNLI